MKNQERTKQERLEFVARNPGFEKSRMYGHLFKDLTDEDLEYVKWLRMKCQSEARRWISGKLLEYETRKN